VHRNESELDDTDCLAKTIETIVEPIGSLLFAIFWARMPVQGHMTLHVNTAAIKWVDSGIKVIGSVEVITLKTQL
jgi:hypothetical protein